jgi:hypothetical protein
MQVSQMHIPNSVKCAKRTTNRSQIHQTTTSFAQENQLGDPNSKRLLAQPCHLRYRKPNQKEQKKKVAEEENGGSEFSLNSIRV